MAEPQPAEPVGWPVLHQFYRIDRTRWRALTVQARDAAIEELTARLRHLGGEEGMQFIPIAGIAKADFGYMAVHPELRRMQQLGQQLTATAFGACLTPVYSFLSISEVSEYMSSKADWVRQLVEEQHLDPAAPEFAQSLSSFEKRMAAYAEARVHPQLPKDLPVICFYPMSKARGETRNWFTLPFEERKKLMGGHAKVGRTWHGKILQLITGSTGLDDWEWGVTLLAHDPLNIKGIVYKMRFDEVSAQYAEFGEFFIGLQLPLEEIFGRLQL